MKLLIFGASEKNLKRYVRLLDFSCFELLAIVDNDQKKWDSIVSKGYISSSEDSYWPIDNVPIIRPEDLMKYEFDYILVGSIYFTDEIVNKLLLFKIQMEKILLLVDFRINFPIYWDINKFANNIDNDVIFKDKPFTKLNKFIESIKKAIDGNILRFKDINIPIEAYRGNENIFYSEFRDILQKYYFDNVIVDYNEGPYETDQMKIENDDVIFDCGANIGLFSSYASIAAEKGTVYAFEPFPEACEILEKTVSYYSNIKIVKKALSNKKESTVLIINDELGNSSLIHDDNMTLNDKNHIIVEVDTIDSFVKENDIKKVDFIKADIEGAERYMLLGAVETIRKFKPKISICTYHLADDKEVLEKIIKDINPEYKIIHRWKKLYAY